jgi:hypothetical protein
MRTVRVIICGLPQEPDFRRANARGLQGGAMLKLEVPTLVSVHGPKLYFVASVLASPPHLHN